MENVRLRSFKPIKEEANQEITKDLNDRPEEKSRKGLGSHFTCLQAILFLGFCIAIIYLCWPPFLRDSKASHERQREAKMSLNKDLEVESKKEAIVAIERPVALIWTRKYPSKKLINVQRVFERLGYKVTFNETDEWDVIWSHCMPFSVFPPDKLKPHQKVNKFPGIGYLTSKVDFATAGGPGVPPSFRLPDDKEQLLEYAKDNPKALFLEKRNTHGSVRIKPLKDIDLDSQTNFVQKFIDNPLLIGGHFFDIGVYVVVTSIDPLRIYRIVDDMGFRFCNKPYHPFNASDPDQYVIGDANFTQWFDFPMSKKYFTHSYSQKNALDANLKSVGKDPQLVWEKIDKLIVQSFLLRERQILELYNLKVKSQAKKRNFFEWMQFDFIFDEDLNVYITEVNMSPNLCSEQYPVNTIKYEQVLFSVFSLVGLATYVHPPYQNSKEAQDTIVAKRNIMVFRDICVECDDCSKFECKLCAQCLSEDFAEDLKTAYREQLNKYGMKRLFPPIMTREEAKLGIPQEYANLSEKNQLQFSWYQGKCLMDEAWCQN